MTYFFDVVGFARIPEARNQGILGESHYSRWLVPKPLEFVWVSAVLALATVALPQPALPFSLWESRSLGSGEGF